MKNILSELTKQFSRVTKSTASALVGKELDWNRIDEARERLVRMRFEATTAADSYMTDIERRNSDIAGKKKLANLAQRDSVGLSRWFADKRQTNSDAISRQIHQAVYRTQASSDPSTDGDWRIVNRQYNSYVLSSLEPEVEYEQNGQYWTEQQHMTEQYGDQQCFDPNVVYTQQSQITAPQSHIATLMEMLEIPTSAQDTPTPIAQTPLASLSDANRDQSFDPEACQHEVKIPVVPTTLANLLDPHCDHSLDLAS